VLRTRVLEPGSGWPDDAGPGPAPSAVAVEEPRRSALVARTRDWRARLPSGLLFSLVVYLISRIPIVVGIVVFVRSHRGQSLTSVVVRQDGWWYAHLAQAGYSSSLHPPLTPRDYHHRYSDWAFYPGFPLLIRGVHELTRLSYLTSAALAATVLGLTAVWAIYSLGRLVGGVPVARASALLMAAWPGSAAFSFPYSEGLFITATALALIFLEKQQWWRAGVFAGIAVATRPTGAALLVAIAVVAGVRLARHRDWRPLVALPLAAAGGVAFLLYGWARTGDPFIWRHAENLWFQKLDFSTKLLERTAPVLADPLSHLNGHAQRLLLVTTVLEIVGLLMLLLMAVAFVRVRGWRWPAMTAYTIVAVGMIVGFSDVASRPRMVLAVLPGFVWSGAWLPRRVTLALTACLLVLLGVIAYAWSWEVTP
jgi:Dolichyl-phosphate-mannose-protein mannosyltransferase